MTKYFPFKSLPIELQDLIVQKMDILTWMNYKLSVHESINVPITKEEWDNAYSDFSDTSSNISDESYDIDDGFSSNDD